MRVASQAALRKGGGPLKAPPHFVSVSNAAFIDAPVNHPCGVYIVTYKFCSYTKLLKLLKLLLVGFVGGAEAARSGALLLHEAAVHLAFTLEGGGWGVGGRGRGGRGGREGG